MSPRTPTPDWPAEYHQELTRSAAVADRTAHLYRFCIQAGQDFMRRTFDRSLPACDRACIRAWFDELKRQRKSAGTLNHHHCAVRSFYTFLLNRNVITRHPLTDWEPRPKVRSTRNQPVPAALVHRLLESFDRTTWLGLRNYLMIALLWSLGLRLRETTALTVGSVELCYQPHRRLALLHVTGKGRKSRTLFLVDRLYDLMIAYLGHPQSPKLSRDPLFPTGPGRAISPDHLRDLVKAAARTAGITQRITPHVLRHCFATDLYHRGVPLTELRALMGHDSSDETAGYIHLAGELLSAALSQLNLAEPSS